MIRRGRNGGERGEEAYWVREVSLSDKFSMLDSRVAWSVVVEDIVCAVCCGWSGGLGVLWSRIAVATPWYDRGCCGEQLVFEVIECEGSETLNEY